MKIMILNNAELKWMWKRLNKMKIVILNNAELAEASEKKVKVKEAEQYEDYVNNAEWGEV